MSLAV